MQAQAELEDKKLINTYHLFLLKVGFIHKLKCFTLFHIRAD